MVGIGEISDAVPADVKALVTSWQSGNVAEAQQWHHKLFPLCRDMLGLSTNPIPVKAAMKLIGRDCGDVRLPLCPLNANELESLRGTLREYGLEV